jgi:hypothetical protein
MELKPEIDKKIQMELISNQIVFPLDERGHIAIHEFRIDRQANAGLLYILPKESLPKGKLPFVVILVQYVYGVFCLDDRLAMIEISSMALNGETAC